MWATVPAVVLLTLVITVILACLTSTYMVGRLRGRTKISVKLFGLGFTVDHSDSQESEDKPNFPIGDETETSGTRLKEIPSRGSRRKKPTL